MVSRAFVAHILSAVRAISLADMYTCGTESRVGDANSLAASIALSSARGAESVAQSRSVLGEFGEQRQADRVEPG